MGTLTTITGPTVEPLTLAEAKHALRVSHDDDNALIMAYIKAARQWVESYTGLKLMTQTIELSFDNFTQRSFPIGVWPLQSIDSVKYDDTASPTAEQTLVADTDYYADITSVGGRVITITGWPSTATNDNSVRVRVTAGYASAAAVPELIKAGIKAYIAYLYDSESNLDQAAMSILNPYRLLNDGYYQASAL